MVKHNEPTKQTGKSTWFGVGRSKEDRKRKWNVGHGAEDQCIPIHEFMSNILFSTVFLYSSPTTGHSEPTSKPTARKGSMCPFHDFLQWVFWSILLLDPEGVNHLFVQNRVQQLLLSSAWSCHCFVEPGIVVITPVAAASSIALDNISCASGHINTGVHHLMTKICSLIPAVMWLGH